MTGRPLLLYCDEDAVSVTSTFALIIAAVFPERIPAGGILIVPRETPGINR